MKKVSLVYEKIDKNLYGWALNGFIDRNNIDISLYNSSPYTNQILDNIIYPEKPPTYNAYFGININSNFYNIKSIDQVEHDEKYLYVINIFHIDIFVKSTKYISISNKVLDDARNGKAYLVFSYPNEGDLAYNKDRLSELILPLNVPKSNVLVIHADFNSANFLNCPFTYIHAHIFPWWLQQFANNLDKPIDYIPTKLYVSYNKEVRVDRAQLLIEYKNNNLLDLGYVSCGHVYNWSVLNNEERNFLKSIEGMSPDNLKISGPGRINPNYTLNKKSYINSFVTITSETEARTDDILYFTEKTFKPILLGHPFMLLGGRNQLAKLKEFGYKTFDTWWDESYDSEVGYKNRISKIIHNLIQLKNKSPQELISMRKDMLDVLKQNQNLFLNTIHSMSSDDHCILTILDNIKNDIFN